MIHWFERFSYNSTPFFVERFVFGLKIRLSFQYHFFIGAKSLPLGHSEEKGGNRNNSKCSLCSFVIVAINFWHGALSGWKSTFSSSFMAIFWRILHSNAPIMLYNIRYWCFFFSQGNLWTKYMTHPGIRGPKPLLADVCVFGRFGRFSPAAVHSANCRFNSRVKWWIHILSIVTCLPKNSFLLRWNICKRRSESSTRCCFWSTVSECGAHCEISFLLEKCLCKMVNALHSDIFNSSVISRNFNLRSAKTSYWRVFFVCFPGQLPNLGDLSIQHVLSVQSRLKSAYHLLTVVSDGVESE